jgi:osmotically-inducible protein OsmY
LKKTQETPFLIIPFLAKPESAGILDNKKGWGLEMKSEEVIDRIKGAVTDATHIDLVEAPLDFRFEDGKLVMEGMVDRISNKRKAVLAAMGVMGKGNVIDRLRVKPASRMDDLQIADHLQDLLDQEYTLEGQAIEVKVGGAEVYLGGEVQSLVHKRLAEVLAWWVPGSINIINNIMVNPPENDSDDEITDTVKLVFERDKLLKESSSGIFVKTRGGIVTLAGSVKSSAARDAAEDDVWCIFGVRDVVNRLGKA